MWGDYQTKQQEEEKALKFRLKVQTQAVERRAHALERIEKRELAAFDRDHRRYARDRARGEEGALPSLTKIIRNDNRKRRDAPDQLRAFATAKEAGLPDLSTAFDRAARGRAEERDGDHSDGSGRDQERTFDMNRSKKRDRHG